MLSRRQKTRYGLIRINLKHKAIIIQAIFLIIVLAAIYFIYPRTSVDVQGNSIQFKSMNANVIILSENPDFSNPRYLDLEEGKNISINLNPGKYYWRASNDLIEGLKKEFTIESEVGMKMEIEENASRLVNVGNVKINVSKTRDGMMVGHIILEPEEGEEVENQQDVKYTGGQND